MCTGTGYVAKRSAIAQIGGWPLAYAGEDYMCSALLTGAGWEVVFVRTPLQSGLAPESLTALLKQRMRWVSLNLNRISRLPLFLFFFPFNMMKTSPSADNYTRKDRRRSRSPSANGSLPSNLAAERAHEAIHPSRQPDLHHPRLLPHDHRPRNGSPTLCSDPTDNSRRQ